MNSPSWRKDMELSLKKASDAEERADYETAASEVRRLIDVLRDAPIHAEEVIAELTARLAGYAMTQGRYNEAIRLCEDAMTQKERLFGIASAEVGLALMALGSALAHTWQLAAADSVYARAETLLRDSPLSTRCQLIHLQAGLHIRQLRHEDAIAECESALKMTAAVQPRPSDIVAALEQDLALALAATGRLAEAQRLYAQLVEAATEQQDNQSLLIGLLQDYGAVLRDQERFDEAHVVTERAVQLAESTLGPMHPTTAYALHNMGLLLMRQKKYVGAEEYLRRSLTAWDGSEVSISPTAADTLYGLALLRGHALDFKQARQLLQRALAIQRSTVAESDLRLRATKEALAVLPDD